MEEVKRAVEEIFSGWEDTAELLDLKEEIAVNLNERIADMQSKGMSRAEAMKRALDELGDVTEAADSLSRKRRAEVIAHAYVRRVPMDRVHAAGYPLAGVVAALGLIFGVMQMLSTGSLMMLLGCLLAFWTPACGAFVFLALTQETRQNHPMDWKRAVGYALSAMLLLFGALVSAITVFRETTLADMGEQGLLALKLQLVAANPSLALGSLIPFVLPGLAVLAFLILTQRSRKKKWVQRLEEEQAKRYGYDERAGLLSGALWIFATGLFVLLGMTVGWRYSWVVYLFAAGVECLLLFLRMPKEKGE